MAKETKFKMSAKRFEEIKEELHYMETVREKEVSEQIKEARSFGDLSENSEYDEAKTEQGKLYSRIAEFKNIIENAEIIEGIENTKSVTLGSKVKVQCLEDDEIEEYKIVGSQEANPMEGRVSNDSPFGRGLMGFFIGDVVKIDAPEGEISYKIVSIENRD